jgi:heme exporter protein A
MRLTGVDLAAVRGGRTVFERASFAVSAGELFAVTGPNGAGKSTLLRLIAGLLQPAAGSLALDPPEEDGIRRQVHYLGHLDALKPGLSLAENLGFWRRLWAGEGATVDAALGSVGLAGLGGLPVAVLSAGQKRRAAIARMLLASRPIWLLDEPTAALDEAAEAMLGRLIGRHLGAGGMVIAATHRDLPLAPTGSLALGAGP